MLNKAALGLDKNWRVVERCPNPPSKKYYTVATFCAKACRNRRPTFFTPSVVVNKDVVSRVTRTQIPTTTETIPSSQPEMSTGQRFVALPTGRGGLAAR